MNIQSQVEAVYENINANKRAFFAVFFIVVLVTYTVLYALDFYPEPKTTIDEPEIETVEESVNTIVTTEVEHKELVQKDFEFSIQSAEPSTTSIMLPSRIVIPNSKTDVVILNPDSVDMTKLDTALLDGVIRHPQSADMDDKGNILILGHSSYLPNVFNRNFQAFNGIQNLVWGDQIFIYGQDGEEQVYRVDRVYLAKASETVIDNEWGKSKLTLVTCNSFASKDDRYIVEATLVSTIQS